jgi:flagellar motor switch protein FliN
MTEDLDKELADLAGDLDNMDLGDAAADSEAAPAADAAGGESVELDADLQAMLNSGDDAPAESSGGEEDILAGAAAEEPKAPARGGAKATAAPAPAPRPAARPRPPAVGLTGDQASNLEFLLDIKLHVTFEVGRSKMLISDLLTLGQGSVIELHRLVGDELDLLINGKLIAKGEVVVVNEKFGCKITDIISPEDRVKHLGTV